MPYLPNIAWFRVRVPALFRSRPPAARASSPAAGQQRPALEAAHARLVALMRCVLAFSALAVIYVDPSEPARLIPLTYGSLAAYCAYSAAVAALAYSRGWPAPGYASHWIDVLFYAWLVGVTAGTASIFFYFFFFAILVAAFSYGYREGLRVTVFSALAFALVGVLYPTGTDAELNRTLIRPVYLFTLGYLMTYWGEQEIQLKERLRLLHEVNNRWSPRFGVEHTIALNLDRLRAFYGADSAVLALKRPGPGAERELYLSLPDKPAECARGNLAADTVGSLLALPAQHGVAYSDRRRFPWLEPQGRSFVADGGRAAECDTRACARIANILDTRSFVTVPYAQRDGTEGRLYLTSSSRAWSTGDGDFLLQFASTVAVVSEGLRLMEELISRAADHERYKISRDLHDSTIQPYIGLKLGLEGLYRQVEGGSAVADRVRDLVAMTNQTVRDLRQYADRLRAEKGAPDEFLVAAVKEQGERYRRYYGIHFEVRTRLEGRRISGRIAAEVFQMIVEGMSNVLKHTSAKRGSITLTSAHDTLTLRIANESDPDRAPRAFAPRSMAERTAALGGRLEVQLSQNGETVIESVIPI